MRLGPSGALRAMGAPLQELVNFGTRPLQSLAAGSFPALLCVRSWHQHGGASRKTAIGMPTIPVAVATVFADSAASRPTKKSARSAMPRRRSTPAELTPACPANHRAGVPGSKPGRRQAG